MSIENIARARELAAAALEGRGDAQAALTEILGLLAPNTPANSPSVSGTPAGSALSGDGVLPYIIDTIPYFVFWKDQNSVFCGCNAAYGRVAGLSDPADIVGLTDHDLPWKKEDCDFYVACDRRVMSSGQAELDIEEPLKQADGRDRYIQTSKVPLRDEHGNVVGILGIFADITDRKRMELDLQAAHASARIVLDNVVQGLVTARPDGSLERERSRAVDTWFGDSATNVFDLFAVADPRFAEWLRATFGDIFEDVLPLELAVMQLPTRFLREERQFEVTYRPIEEGGRVVRVLIVITDVTEAMLANRADEEQRELLAVFQAILQDRTAFVQFVGEMRARFAILSNTIRDRVSELRDLHTLKGNAGFFGLSSTARICHELEDKLALEGTPMDEDGRTSLRAHWADIERRIEPLLGAHEQAISLSAEEYEGALSAALSFEPHSAIVARIRSWADDPTRKRLTVHARQVSSLAARLGKGDVTVRIDDGGLRLSRERYADIWANLVHVVRNAVDHGLESPEERVACRKSAAGEITLATRVEGGDVVIEVADDGRGIDWAKVKESAARRGLPTNSAKDLVDAIFADGVSTRDEVSDVSGRGVGMAAVRDSVVVLGGRIEIISTRGCGSRFLLRVPCEARPISRSGRAKEVQTTP